MPGQKETTWKDLANLGWPIQQVVNEANKHRGGTMDGKGDIALNERFAADYQYVCLDDPMIGALRLTGFCCYPVGGGLTTT
jgi:hypothetical protein